MKEIVDELDYLKGREERFQQTNSASRHPPEFFLASHPYSQVSTQSRVKKFAYFMLASLVGLGVWQIFHLRAFFKRKYLID